jgi:predicted membrane protein (TIGR00267 family)
MAFFLKEWIDKAKQYNKIAKVGKIARRYFAMNSFDGVLTILGILIGSYFGGITESRIIIHTALGASIAMMISGIWGTYLTEHAERQKSLHDLEKSTLTKLGHTRIGEASRYATVLVAIIDGLSPITAALVVMMPFFFSSIATQTIYFYSVGIGFAILFLLGMFLGRISKESMIKSGLKMVLAGIVCGLVGWFFLR